MSMVTVLAWVAVSKLGGINALTLRLQAVREATASTGVQTANPLKFSLISFGMTTNAVWTIPLVSFVLFLGVQWWSSWYPGAEPGGGGYVAQRMFSAKDEKNSLAATYGSTWRIRSAAMAMDCDRTGGAGVVFAERRTDAKRGLCGQSPTRLRDGAARFSAAGIAWTDGRGISRGVHVHDRARSSIGEHSYLVNDFYRRFLVRDAGERHYVNIEKYSRCCWCWLVATLPATGFHLEGGKSYWESEPAPERVLILRWYWWRINAWSEISATVTAAVLTFCAGQIKLKAARRWWLQKPR